MNSHNPGGGKRLGCKASEVPRNEAYWGYAAVTRDEDNPDRIGTNEVFPFVWGRRVAWLSF
jgi:hypothetical protein